MKRLLLLIIALTLPATARPDWKAGYVTADEVRLRRGPSPSSAVVTSLSRGQLLGVLERKDGWAHVFPVLVYVATKDLDEKGVVRAVGTPVLLEARDGAPVLARAQAGVKFEGVEVDAPYRAVQAPEDMSFWVADSYLSSEGLRPRSEDFVDRAALKIASADLQKIASLEGLRFVVLPTDAPDGGELLGADSGRFGPSYSVRYKSGSEWMTIGAATGGLGGFGVNLVEFVLPTPLLGRLTIGSPGLRDHKELMFEAAPLAGGSTLNGKPFPLTIHFECSPGFDRALLRRTLQSLKVVRL